MDDDEIRRFLSTGTRTGKLAWAAADGQPHVAPIWFVVDDDGRPTGGRVQHRCEHVERKGAGPRPARVSLVVDDDTPPFAFVKLTGAVTVSEDPDELRTWAARIAGRYMGADRAEEFGRRNGVPGELLVRLRPTRVIAEADVAD